MCRLMKVMLAVIMLSSAVPGTLAGCSSGQATAQGPKEGYQVGDLAPGFGLQNLAGQMVALPDFRGKPVLRNFWATWCPPCREEMPLLQEVFQDKALADKGLVVLTVDLGESPATVEAFMKSNGYSFPVLLDTQQIVANTYNVRGIPTTFFIDKDGIIREVRIGAFANKTQVIMSLRKVLP